MGYGMRGDGNYVGGSALCILLCAQTKYLKEKVGFSADELVIGLNGVI